MDEGDVVALRVVHRAAHAGKTFAEAQIVGGIVLGRFALRPVPVAAVLQIHDENGVVADNHAPFLESQVVHATDALFENLRSHDRRANRKHHAAIESLDRRAELAKIDRRGAAQHRTVKHRVVRNDVVADTGMHGKRHAPRKCLGEHAGVFPRMFHLVPSRREAVRPHRHEQFRAGRGQRMGRLGAQELFEHFRRRQSHALLNDETSKAAPVTFAVQRAGQQREMSVAPGLVPGAESAGGDILLDTLGRASKKSPFPIVNGARPVGGEMRDPATGHELIQQKVAAVFQKMRSVNQQDARAALAGRANFFNGLMDDFRAGLGARRKIRGR